VSVKVIPGVYTALATQALPTTGIISGGVVGFVGDFVLGKPNEIIELSSLTEIDNKLGGLAKADAKALYAILAQKPQKVKVVRIVGTGAAKASVTLQDSTPDDLLTLTALYEGAYGNDISVEVADSGGTLKITYGGTTETYSVSTIEDLANTINASSSLVTATFVSEGTLVDGTFALTGGSDGTIDDSTYIGGYDAVTDTRSGLALFEVDQEVEIITMGGTPSATKNSALISHADDYNRVAVLPLVDGQNLNNALSEVANYSSPFGRAITAFPDVVMSIDGTATTISAAYPLAGLLGATSPHKNPVNTALAGVTGVARGLTVSEMESLINKSINPVSLKGSAYCLRHGKTLTSDSAWEQINVVRVFNLIAQNADSLLDDFVGEANTPELWQAVNGRMSAYLTGLKTAGWIQDYQVICDATINPPEEREAGRLNVALYVKPVFAAYYINVEINKVLSFAGVGGEA